jgi:hypothetical protein
MGTGYVRNDSANNIADGNVIDAADLDGEFDAVQAAFNASTGHSHDGTVGEGPLITSAGLAAGAITSAAIANDSVALGTKTTGNYVAAGAVSGTGLSGSASAEGATFTVTSNATDANTASTIVARDASGNFSAGTITATLSGNATTATTATTANAVAANSVALGTDTTGNYVAVGAVSGTGLSGSSSSEGGTFTVTSNATNANTASTIVARDGSGNFSAGTITAALTGNVTGNVTGSSGSTTGNAATATKWATTRTITLTGDVTSSATNIDGSGNVSIGTTLAASGFDAGTLMLFQQTAAPTGWTKQTTHNNKALRVVTGSASSGGSSAFTTAFGTPSVSGTVGLSGAPDAGNLAVSISGSISNTTLSTSQMPSHSHSTNLRRYVNEAGGGTQDSFNYFNDTVAINKGTNSTGSSGSHNHGHNLSGTQTGAPGVGNLAGSLSSATASINVQYVDLIIAAKD